jgi:hypothetical protein
MNLVIDDYTKLELNIERTHTEEENEEDRLCAVTLKVKNPVLDYKIINKEILTENEIMNLIDKMKKLLEGKLDDSEHIEFNEPDIEIVLYPSEEVEESIADIRLNILQNEVLSADYYNLCILKNDIEMIYNYLRTLMQDKLDTIEKEVPQKVTDSKMNNSKANDYTDEDIFEIIKKLNGLK